MSFLLLKQKNFSFIKAIKEGDFLFFMEDIILKLKECQLLGRSGSNFPTWLKWEMVKKAKAKKKYVVCNGAEGEPGVFKDKFLLENFAEEVIEGIKIALFTLKAEKAFLYLKKDYYQKFKEKLKKLIKNLPIILFEKPEGYLAGEETALIQAIEGKTPLPTLKPPFPTERGLFGYPTLINNVETFYYVGKVFNNEYQNKRFYCISGEVKNPGVFELPIDFSILEVLKSTNNLPDFDFFVQVGGGALGEILLKRELNQKIRGLASIIVFNKEKTDPFSLMKNWVNLFLKENCDRCVPCREGVFRLAEMIEKRKLEKEKLEDLFFVLKNTSFCALGKAVSLPFESLIKKLLWKK